MCFTFGYRYIIPINNLQLIVIFNNKCSWIFQKEKIVMENLTLTRQLKESWKLCILIDKSWKLMAIQRVGWITKRQQFGNSGIE